MKKLLSVVLALMLALSACVLAGCLGDSNSIVGKWECKIDFSDAVKEGLEDAEEGLADAFSDVKIEALYNFEFKDNGEFSMILDEDALVESFNGLKDTFADYFKTYFAQMLEGTGYSVEDALAAQNLTMDDLVDQAIEEGVDAMKKSLGEASKSGKYKVENNKLFLAEDGEDFDDDDYVEFEFIANDRIKFTKFSVSEEDSETIEKTLPWTLIKK